MRRALILLGLILAGLGARLPAPADAANALPATSTYTQSLVAGDTVPAIPVVRTGGPVIAGLSGDALTHRPGPGGRLAPRSRLASGNGTDPLRTARSTALSARSGRWRSYASADALDRAGRIASRSTAPPATRIV